MLDSASVYNVSKPDLLMRKLRFDLDEPSMYRHGLGTRITERLSMSHMNDMIDTSLSTIETTSLLVMIGLGVVNLDRVH